MWADIYTIFMIDSKILLQIELITPGSKWEWNFCARIHITLLQIMYDCKCFFFLRQFPFSFDSTFISKFYFIILNFKSSRKWLQKTYALHEPRQLLGFWICRFIFIFQVDKALFYFPYIFLLQKVSWSEPFEGTCRHCSFPIVSR